MIKLGGFKIWELSILILICLVLSIPLAIFSYYSMQNAFDYLIEKYAIIGIFFIGLSALIIIKKRKKNNKIKQEKIE